MRTLLLSISIDPLTRQQVNKDLLFGEAVRNLAPPPLKASQLWRLLAFEKSFHFQ
jgi:hypothetical protein